MASILDDVDNQQTKIVNVWKRDIRVKPMSLTQTLKFYELSKDKDKQGETILQVIVWTCIDDNGDPLFNDADKTKLDNKPKKSLLKLFNAAIELVNMDEESIEAEKKS